MSNIFEEYELQYNLHNPKFNANRIPHQFKTTHPQFFLGLAPIFHYYSKPPDRTSIPHDNWCNWIQFAPISLHHQHHHLSRLTISPIEIIFISRSTSWHSPWGTQFLIKCLFSQGPHCSKKRWSGRTRGKFHRHETVASRREIGDIDKNNKFNGQLPVVVITSHHSFRSWKWDQFLILPCFPSPFPQSLFYRTHATRKSVCERKLEIFWRLPLTIHQAAAVPCRNQIIGIPHHSAMSQSRWLLKVADAIKWF